MPLKTLPFDGAEYLGSHEGQIELLADAESTGRRDLHPPCAGRGSARGITDIARQAGISRRVLFDAILDEEQTGLDALLKISRALGVSPQGAAASAAE